MARSFRFRLSIHAEELLRFYRGDAEVVIAHTAEGVRVQFPAARLRPFVTKEGVTGMFELRCDENNRIVSLRRTSF